jgi:putative phage-type endonuclease
MPDDNFIEKLFIEIYDISNDYINNCIFPLILDDLVSYICFILKNIYDKKDSKYFYKEIIEQLVLIKFPYLNNKYNFNLNNEELKFISSQITYLNNLKLPEQRSAEWFESRMNSIGASELATVFNKNPFCSKKKFILKKCGYKDPGEENNISIHCLHGVKFEEVIQKIYAKRNNTVLKEYGSIPHKKYSFIRASPDGITEEGIMLEIKAPFQRKILGLPPIYYWMQMQQQLEVCDLNKCDFLECKIVEYSWDEFIKDNYQENYTRTENNLEKGLIIEFKNIGETNPWNIYGYYYPEIGLTLNQHKKWVKNIKRQLLKDKFKNFVRVIPWKINKYSCISIYRNKYWWQNNIPIIKHFWNELLLYKKNGYDELIPIKKIKKKKTPQCYDFLEINDSDTEIEKYNDDSSKKIKKKKYSPKCYDFLKDNEN